MNRVRLLILFFCAFCPLHFAYAAQVQTIKTPGGFTIWLAEEHSLPLIATNITFLRNGTAYDAKDMPGRANMVVGLLMEGAGDRNSQTFDDALESHAIRLNIGLDEDIVGASMQTLSENKDIAFSLLSDALVRPRFDDEAIARMKAKTISLLKEQSGSPYYKLERSWQERMYGDHNYASPALGTESSINAITKAQLQAYHKNYFAKDNMIISIAGDISAKEATRLIDEKFAGITPAYKPDFIFTDIAFPAKCMTHITPHEMPQTIVRFAMQGIKRKDPDYLTAYVLNHIMGGGLGSILSKEIRTNKGLVYSINAQLDPQDHAASWGGVFATQHDQAKAAIVDLRQTLANIKAKGISSEELDDAKAYLTGSFILNLDSNTDIVNFLTIMQRFDLGKDYMEKRNTIVAGISTADINRVAKRLITPENLCIIAVGKGDL